MMGPLWALRCLGFALQAAAERDLQVRSPAKERGVQKRTSLGAQDDLL